jgi:8-oxo-(d)GTP phosphatase
VLLLRHASAGERSANPREDRERRLDSSGRADARAFSTSLAGHAIDRIVSSPHARCVESVAGLARGRDVDVECREELAPDASRNDTLTFLAELADDTLVCTHREVFDRLFRGSVTCEKGGIWIARRDARRRAPQLLSYLPPRSSATIDVAAAARIRV